MSARKLGSPVLAALFIASIMVVFSPGVAYADRCEPLELIVRQVPGYGDWEDPGYEDDNPLCYVALTYLYPAICDNYATLGSCLGTINPHPEYHLNNFVYPFLCDDYTTPESCLQTLNPHPEYRPTTHGYRPEPLRVACTYLNHVKPTCTQQPIWPLICSMLPTEVGQYWCN